MIDDMILTFSILHGNVLYVNIFEIILHDDITCKLTFCVLRVDQWHYYMYVTKSSGRKIDMILLAQGVEKL